MSANPYNPPLADLNETVAPTENIPALWSPGVAAGLSFFLSPIFGAIINMKNWQAMGEMEKAGQSKMWIFGTVAYYVALIVLAVFVPENRSMDWLYRGAGIGFFIAWYMVSGKDQKDVVEYRYGKSYVKRGWTKPVLITFGIYIAFVVAFTAILIVAFPDVGANVD
jgi:hypothetical protein